ncbi:MAG TPA: polysaccharide deacetylase family protein [Usitatibacter sp.]|nr:polysaccharide deacetylase family protein [Usitatibacter sp.]
MKLALKIDVDTYRGTREGVPALVELLKRHEAGATFLFSLGPDHTGRAIKRAFRPGFMEKVGRTSVVEHYGITTLLYGTVLPGPDIGRRCASTMKKVRDEGFEVGIHTWDHVKWQDGVGAADEAWTGTQMKLACDRFDEIFSAKATVHGAAGWQMNVHAYRRTQSLGFRYASDTRGTHPFIPVIRGEIVMCPQYPTTLPTLDEMIGLDGVTTANAADALLERTREAKEHVFTLHAELEGMKLSPVLDKLLEGWKAQGYSLVSMKSLVDGHDPTSLPLHSVVDAPRRGRSGTLASQGPAFLPE